MSVVIAIVEDDADQRRFYAEALREDYEVAEYEDREQAIAAFEQALPDLAILDIALKSEVGGGFDICRYLKQRDPQLPVLMLTSRGDELDRIYGLQLGAWDYQTKPVTLEFLRARIESLLNIRRLAASDETVLAEAVSAEAALQRDGLQLDAKRMQCRWQGREIRLTPTEFSLLQTLFEADSVVSIDELVHATRQGLVEENTISTHILHIRKKFKQVDDDFNCIRTRYGMGYQWQC